MDAARAPLLDKPMLELTLEEISMSTSPLELEEDFEFLCLSIENETAFSNTFHSETEEPQHSPPDIQTLTPELPLSSPTPPKYMMASGPSANSLHLDVEIKTMDTQHAHRVTALLNSGVTGLFLDSEFVKCHGLTMQPLPKSILVYNIDKTPNEAGNINSMVILVLHYWNHMERTVFAITSLGMQDMILGFMWLCKHNSEDLIAEGIVCVYLDDILIYTKTLEEHCQITCLILEHLCQHQLYLKLEKYKFKQTQIGYLGLIISYGAIEMDPVKVAGVTEWPEPKSKKEVQASALTAISGGWEVASSGLLLQEPECSGAEL
ncbi:hypothetical protein E4T56_gene18502 [Termitomyces sp. T112]|nr:hypothetical protein E4T56_gene18502 [Termitomyces sp. T112]